MNNYTDRLQREAEDYPRGNYGHRVIKTVKTGKQSQSDIGNTFVGGPLSSNLPETKSTTLTLQEGITGEDNPVINSLVELNMPGLGWGESATLTRSELRQFIYGAVKSALEFPLKFEKEEGEDIRKEIQIELPKGFYNVTITVENNLVADTNNSINWDTLKIPLPSGLWIIKNIIGKTVSLSTFPSTAENKEYDLVKHLYRQIAFSTKTFGPDNRWKGVVDHIRQELEEIEADPTDLIEWVDVILLAFDAAWRMGKTPEEIVSAIDAKLTKNEKRTWPDWRTMNTDKAINHDRSKDESQPSGIDKEEETELREAAKSILKRMSTQYKAGNGRMCGFQDEHGDLAYIVPFDDIERLKSIVSNPDEFKRKWKWDIHFRTLFDTIETMDEFFNELMREMNGATNNGQFQILKVMARLYHSPRCPFQKGSKQRHAPDQQEVGLCQESPIRLPTIKFEKFEEKDNTVPFIKYYNSDGIEILNAVTEGKLKCDEENNCRCDAAGILAGIIVSMYK